MGAVLIPIETLSDEQLAQYLYQGSQLITLGDQRYVRVRSEVLMDDEEEDGFEDDAEEEEAEEEDKK